MPITGNQRPLLLVVADGQGWLRDVIGDALTDRIRLLRAELSTCTIESERERLVNALVDARAALLQIEG